MTHQASCIHWEPVDTRPSECHNLLQMFPTPFPNGKLVIYLKHIYIYIPRRTQQTNTANERHTRARRELFSRSARKQNDFTDVIWMSLLHLQMPTDLRSSTTILFILTSVEQ